MPFSSLRNPHTIHHFQSDIMKNPYTLKALRIVRQGGFTLMELMLVLAIIGLLIVASTKIAPAIMKKGKVTAAKTDIGNLSGFVLSYQNTHGGRLPSSLSVLKTSGDITDAMTKDPWGNDYILTVPGKRSKEKFDLYSIGSDGVDGNEDDIGNWESE